MEKYEENLAVDKAQGFPTMSTTSSSTENSAEEFDQIPLSVYLKETTGTASTNGVHELTTNTFEKTPFNEKIPVDDNIENMPSFVDDISVMDRENDSTVLEKDPCILETDRENNILEKEPYLLDIGRENNNIPEKEPYVSLIDKENNIILDKALSEPVVDRKENGEVLSKEPDALFLEKEDISAPSDTEKPTQVKDVQPNKAMTHTSNKHCCEVRLTLSKPNPVKNRSARPFGAQSLVTSHTPPPAVVASPVVEFPPPPTYAESFSSPPPVTRVRSPPAYSALYPSEKQKVPAPQASLPQAPVVQAPVPQPSVPHAPVQHIPVPETALPQAPVSQTKFERSRSGPLLGESTEVPQTKTGFLEESLARRGAKKSMFTFVEKPKVAPNPDLLNLVQRADNWKKQREQGGAIPEEEPFALGAEASNFLPESRAKAELTEAPTGNVPEWSSCLRSPRIQPRPRIQSNQSLPEAKGKGAELFAKRQSRMQKYTIEAPSQPDITRSPSPTMSLPPSWKFASETHISPMAFRPPPRSPARSPKTTVLVYNSNMSESENSNKELEISKQQSYQIQPSMFISSPVKYPKAAPPPSKPVVSQHNYMRQASCPTSPWLPSAGFHSPVQPNPNISLPGLFPSPTGTMLIPQNIRTSIEASSEPTFEYSSRILSPRAKGVFQAPRPSYSTRNAGIEPQEGKASLPSSPTWTPHQLRRQSSSLHGWGSPAPTPEPEEGLADVFRAAAVLTPPPPMSPSWSERSLSPFRQETDPKSSRQMQVLLARNIINAARRKSSSPKATGSETFRPFTPPATVATMSSSSGGSPKSVGNHLPSPLQSPRPMRMDGYRRVSLPTPIPQVSASSSNSPRLLGSQSPTYKSPLQSPKTVRMNGNKYFTLPANTGASLFSPAPAVHSVAHNRDRAQSPKHIAVDSHGTFIPSGSTSKKPFCTSPKNMSIFSPTTKSPLQSPTMRVASPVKRYTSLSPTNSDVSLDSEDSGIRSPSIRSFNICPRGWNGSLRLKRGSLPAEAPCTS